MPAFTESQSDAPESPITRYPGAEVDVTWDGRLCIHVGECGRSEGDLFQGGRQPWCEPDRVSAEDVTAVVRRCPTGALAWHPHTDAVAPESPPVTNQVVVANNGPLYLTGDLVIDGAAEDMPGVRTRAALCRCGQSANKPFCDNSHERVGFVDRGAVGSTGPGAPGAGGPLEVNRAANGPLLLKGNVTVVAGTGRVAWQGARCALCRCGGSSNKPFCDGSHRALGFQAE